jgi:hypothetical protein
MCPCVYANRITKYVRHENQQEGKTGDADVARGRGLRFEVFSAVTMKNAVFWDVTPCFFAACVGCWLQLALFLVHRFLPP